MSLTGFEPTIPASEEPQNYARPPGSAYMNLLGKKYCATQISRSPGPARKLGPLKYERSRSVANLKFSCCGDEDATLQTL
jgi:hypothetical protein